jgi:hypothetical protein
MMKLITTTNGIIRVIACWAFVLGLLSLAHTLTFSLAFDQYTSRFGSELLVWSLFLLDILFGLGFFISGYGLWLYKSWGRTLFLWLITAWVGFNIIGLLFLLGQYTASDLAINIIRFAITLFIPLWYLHRPHVKAFFEANNLYRLEE